MVHEIKYVISKIAQKLFQFLAAEFLHLATVKDIRGSDEFVLGSIAFKFGVRNFDYGRNDLKSHQMVVF